MNKSNERLMAILIALRKMPRWALILLTVGVIVILGVAMFLLLPQTQTSQTTDPSAVGVGLAFGVFLKMGVVVLLIVGAAIVIRRWQTKSHINQTKIINVLETVHLAQKQTLYLINVDGKKILIGATDQTISNLYQSEDVDAFSSNSPEKNFPDVLAQVISPSDHVEDK